MKNVVIVILSLLILALGGFIVYDKFIEKDAKKTDNGVEKKSNESQEEAKAIDLNELIGTWYETNLSSGFPNSNYLLIKSVDNNKLTFNIYFTRTAEFENVTAEIVSNNAEFEAISENGLDSDGNPGKAKIRMNISDDLIKITILETDVRDLESGKEYNFTYVNK